MFQSQQRPTYYKCFDSHMACLAQYATGMLTDPRYVVKWGPNQIASTSVANVFPISGMLQTSFTSYGASSLNSATVSRIFFIAVLSCEVAFLHKRGHSAKNRIRSRQIFNYSQRFYSVHLWSHRNPSSKRFFLTLP